MRVALVHDAVLPVAAYGGTERVVWWLSKALAARGLDVVLACAPGSECSWAQVIHPDFNVPIESQIEADVTHYFNTPSRPPERPYMVTIGGNGRPHEAFLHNTAFVSRNHALRHGAQCFVYNGLDPDDYIYSDRKDGSLLFLAKAAWKVKNVSGAIRLARKARRELQIVGGSRWWLPDWRGVHWRGMLGGQVKAEIISRCSGLLFPVVWNEPFGLAVVEALVSGTPVLASPYGSLPELVAPEVGRICRTPEEFLQGIEALGQFRPTDCRDWAVEKFSYQRMGEEYLRCYERVLRGETLNWTIPVTRDPMDALDAIAFRTVAGNISAQPA